jgi:tetratricopeptide (TPR) repeat protein
MVFNTGLADAAKAGLEKAYALHFTALLADTSLLLGKDADADGYVKRALDMADTQHRGDPKSLVQVVMQLASIYSDHRRFDKAEPLGRRAVETLAALQPVPDDLMATAEQKLGWVLIQLGKLEESEKLLRHALETRLKSKVPDAADMVPIQSGLAALALKAGRIEEAKSAADEALRVCKLHKPEQHPDTAACLLLVASAEFSAGHKTEARDACRHAVEIFEATLGDEHPQSRGARELLEQIKK